MRCPACLGPTKIVVTVPAEKRSDGRVYRHRRCQDSACDAKCSTLEVLRREVGEEEVEQEEAVRKARKVAIPSIAPPTMYDVEGELEKGLPLAVEVIVDAVRPGTTPDRTKFDAARWLLDDRRKWRIAMAEQANRSGVESEDPAVAQLSNVLRLVGE